MLSNDTLLPSSFLICSKCGIPNIMQDFVNPFSKKPVCKYCNLERQRISVENSKIKRTYKEPIPAIQRHKNAPDGSFQKRCKSCNKTMYIIPSQTEAICDNCGELHGVTAFYSDRQVVKIWKKVKFKDPTDKILSFIERRGKTYRSEIVATTDIRIHTAIKCLDKLEKDGKIKIEKKGQTKWITLI